MVVTVAMTVLLRSISFLEVGRRLPLRVNQPCSLSSWGRLKCSPLSASVLVAASSAAMISSYFFSTEDTSNVKPVVANSCPAMASITPKTDVGTASNNVKADEPKNIASRTLQVPKKTTEAPWRAPNLCCPARPPAPWQFGIAPKGTKKMFISPTDMLISFREMTASFFPAGQFGFLFSG